jgi:hypothetical protein
MSSTPLPAALDMQVSDVNAFFASKAYTNKIKRMESEGKLWVALIGRGDGTIRAIGESIKAQARFARHRRR